MRITNLLPRSWAHRTFRKPASGYRRFSLVTSCESNEPLRILFCGSDEFSVSSLRALYQYSIASTNHVASINVATRTDKRTGRGLKIVSSSPIKLAAQEIGLQIHQFDTFTGWSPPSDVRFNMIIAVSFGLKVPPRILNDCQFGGLNVHPSLLPDLKGASPIESAIIHGDKQTGVTVQTLHPHKFDEGRILAQTSPLTIPEPNHITATQLRRILAPVGANLLVQTIKDRSYLQTDIFMSPKAVGSRHAPKFDPAARQVSFETMTAKHICRLNRAIPKLWFLARTKPEDSKGLRVILEEDVREAQPSDLAGLPNEVLKRIEIGVPFSFIPIRQNESESKAPLLVRTNEDQILLISHVTVAGGKRGNGTSMMAKAGLFATIQEDSGIKVCICLYPISPT